MAFVMRAVSCVGYAFAKISHARDAASIETHAQKGRFPSSLNRWASPGLISTQPAIGLIRLCLR